MILGSTDDSEEDSMRVAVRGMHEAWGSRLWICMVVVAWPCRTKYNI